jgi:hypothetical protein
LTVAGIFWTPNQPQEGDLVAFSFSVSNQGNAQASPFACALLIDGVQVDTSAGHSLAAGESATIQFSLQWAATPGSHTVTVEADWGGEVEEASKDNNGMAATVTVSPKPIPTDTATTTSTLVPTLAPSPTPSATPMLSPTATTLSSCEVSRAELGACAQDNNYIRLEFPFGDDMSVRPNSVECHPEFSWVARGYQTCSAGSCDPDVCAGNILDVRFVGSGGSRRARVSVVFGYRLELYEGYESNGGVVISTIDAYAWGGEDKCLDLWFELPADTQGETIPPPKEERLSIECEVSFKPGDIFEVRFYAFGFAGEATMTLDEVNFVWLE